MRWGNTPNGPPPWKCPKVCFLFTLHIIQGSFTTIVCIASQYVNLADLLRVLKSQIKTSCRKLSSQTTDTGYSSPRMRTPLAALISISPVLIFGRLRVPHAFYWFLARYIYSVGLALEYQQFVLPRTSVLSSAPAPLNALMNFLEKIPCKYFIFNTLFTCNCLYLIIIYMQFPAHGVRGPVCSWGGPTTFSPSTPINIRPFSPKSVHCPPPSTMELSCR
jgi:hypothetical protein